MVQVKRALISVSDKSNLEYLIKGLNSLGVEMISTGGTARFISSLGIATRPVEEVTGFPEMLDGRVKTLHPKIHGGLLALRDRKEHIDQINAHGIGLIDMVVINLYPFLKTVAKPGVALEEAIENIDIGGPSMIRSAAKNYCSVAVVTDPSQYPEIMKELNDNGVRLSNGTLSRLAVEAFRLTSSYDTAIHAYLQGSFSPAEEKKAESSFPRDLLIRCTKLQDLRYGENSHQRAAFYKWISSRESSISNAQQLHGQELSYNNIMDLDAALLIVKEFDRPAACIIKHANPCGVAVADNLLKAFTDAHDSDKLSAFGGIIGLNRKVDIAAAEAILASGFVECIIAAGYEPAALQRLKAKENLRLLSVEPLDMTHNTEELDVRKVVGGLLIQSRDLQDFDRSALKIVTQKKPTPEEVDALIFAWKVVKHVKSNAIVLAQGTKTVGIGAGQMSRVDSVFIAIHKAHQRVKGSVLASDAFFPKEDAVEIAAKAGVTSVIQPGGSKADEKIIALANQNGFSMVFTGIRHFRH